MLKLLDVHPGSGMENIRIRDLGWKKVGSGRLSAAFYYKLKDIKIKRNLVDPSKNCFREGICK